MTLFRGKLFQTRRRENTSIDTRRLRTRSHQS